MTEHGERGYFERIRRLDGGRESQYAGVDGPIYAGGSGTASPGG